MTTPTNELATLRAQLADVLGQENAAIEYWVFDRDHTRALLASARVCPCCGSAHFWFINREGRTRCVACDGEYVVAQAIQPVHAGSTR